MLLIGNLAALRHGVDLGRKPRDIDLIINPVHLKSLNEFFNGDIERTIFIDKDHLALKMKTGEIIELELAWPGTTSEQALTLMKARKPALKTIVEVGDKTITTLIADLDLLLALKMSHRYKKNSPHFKKTMDDILVLRKAGVDTSKLNEFIKAREGETYTYAHPNLKVMKKDFFRDDGIKYVYDHDSIHVAVKHLDRPAYQYFSASDEEVFSSKEEFFKLPRSTQLLAVLEESYVLALERSQIPFRGKVSARASFNMALMKVCTSITSGWFREFAWENFYEVDSMYEPDYAEKFFEKADAGLVKLHEQVNTPA